MGGGLIAAAYAATVIGLCTVIYLGFTGYILWVSFRNKYKLDVYTLITFAFIAISNMIWFSDYLQMAMKSPGEQLGSSFYLDPFFLFCVGLLFYMCRLVLIVLAIKNMKTYKRNACLAQIVLITATVLLSALFGV